MRLVRLAVRYLSHSLPNPIAGVLDILEVLSKPTKHPRFLASEFDTGNLINLTSFGGKALVSKLWPLLYKRAELDLRLTNIFFVIVLIQIEELYSNLTKKNGEIYVHRGKALREKVQKRTRLLSFNLASTEFLIFSDVSMTGKETILDFIKVQIHRD